MTRSQDANKVPGAGWDWLPVHPGWLLAGLAALALVTASRVYLSLALKNVAEPFPVILLGEGLKWSLWIPVIPLVVAVDRRAGFGSNSRLPSALVSHLLLALGILAVHTVIMTAVGQSAGWYFAQETARATATIRLVHEGGTVFLVYGVVVALDHVQRHRREREKSRLTESRLEAQLATERLRNLQAQLHPHFVFNALHAVAGLLREEDRGGAVKIVEKLGDLLRTSLRRADRQLVRLSEELEFLRTYLDIQQARYEEQLEVVWNVDAEVTDVLVPHLLLQPLVENAVRHGVEQTLLTGNAGQKGRIEIVARGSEIGLQLEVIDNGPGPPASPQQEKGVGLSNTLARLKTHYGEDFSFIVDAYERGGTRVSVEIPMRRKDSHP